MAYSADSETDQMRRVIFNEGCLAPFDFSFCSVIFRPDVDVCSCTYPPSSSVAVKCVHITC